ncbi:catalase/peroxidase HPI [Sphingomonas sp. S17]|uniref:Catalase-peroxidase n=2 Tax=Sphingomonas paucimobilis TaxID=13689 RepID=A0A411LKD2_SPHPI|nr:MULTISPECIES: catalase/peroxidase HPI [Sphingomonas]EGI54306.1 catalase/peroxidase HPI [Sphingomonas sp. S17]MBQ1481717.1 catalase/peroxidase HPI [Sphingomonas sp.]MCM3680634.1 catalase/peroxidase HPI [Sphingomonas paucimobilis]MDG5969939.1 catalase/peroxidase HPI [Sphingomonas paucimobilis]NNG55946.1 catalase/peroxidase HPI [Sphingomonas paucimobilis]
MEDYKTVLEGKCPFGGDRIGGAFTTPPTLTEWYPNRLRVEQLHRHGPQANPLGEDFDYRAAFAKIDLQELKAEIKRFLTSSVAWWPSDYGNYGPQMIRMSWHSAGSYRIADGRGGAGEAMQRFAPINSWWDNGNVDKSRRLLWPIKQKYGAALSWADLIVLTGNCSLEIMGLPTYGFGGGREDAWEADDATYWGPEVFDMTKVDSFDEMVNRDKRWRGQNGDADYDLEQPLAASHQSLIYVNPEGPYASGDPMASARDIRITFTRMAMNDEETVALIAGGHAFGKSHGMVKADRIGAPPEIAAIEEMGLGWHNPEGTGNAEFTMTNGIEGSWTQNPTQWDNSYLENLLGLEWEQTRSPAGALQWTPVNADAPRTPDAHIAGKSHALMMMTSDIALKVDPVYRPICERFLNDFDYFTEQFSKAWYKLTHRDMGPRERYVGPEVTIEPDLLWQDPIPERDYELIDAADIAQLKQQLLGSGLSVSDLVFTAFSAAVTYRDSDKRGGANGARLALAPQKDWAVNRRTVPVIAKLREIMDAFNQGAAGGKRVSLADLIVLGGTAAVEKAAADAGLAQDVPFTAGRRDTTDELTDADSFEWLKPVVDGFRNYVDDQFAEVTAGRVAPEELFLDKAALLKLSAPEWVVLTGGLRALGANWDESEAGLFTDRVGVLSNDFFRVLTSMDYVWTKQDEAGLRFTLDDRDSGETRFTATRNDLIFGANSQLRNIAEFYAAEDAQPRMVRDFVRVWTKVMTADLF